MAKAKRKMTRRSWTADELKKLKALAKKRAGAATIAKELKRTAGAVRQRASAMKVSLETRAGAM